MEPIRSYLGTSSHNVRCRSIRRHHPSSGRCALCRCYSSLELRANHETVVEAALSSIPYRMGPAHHHSLFSLRRRCPLSRCAFDAVKES